VLLDLVRTKSSDQFVLSRPPSLGMSRLALFGNSLRAKPGHRCNGLKTVALDIIWHILPE
jgi:hypothetical protein